MTDNPKRSRENLWAENVGLVLTWRQRGYRPGARPYLQEESLTLLDCCEVNAWKCQACVVRCRLLSRTRSRSAAIEYEAAWLHFDCSPSTVAGSAA